MLILGCLCAWRSVAFPASQGDLDQGLVAYYPLDEGTGTLAYDRSGQGNDGRLVGAEWVKGRHRAALDFDGFDDYVDCGDHPTLRVAEALTLTVWANTPRLHGNQYLVSKRGWNIYLGSDGRPRFETRDAANRRWDTLTAKHPLRAGEWAFLAAVHNPQTQRLEVYVNGELSNAKARTDGRLGGVVRSKLLLGTYASHSQYFNGLLAELRIYNRALRPSEIKRLYQQGQQRFEVSLRPPTFRLSLHPRLYPTRGRVVVDFYLRALQPVPEGTSASVELREAATNRPVQRQRVEVPSAGELVRVGLAPKSLAPGDYEVRGAVHNRQGKILATASVPFAWPQPPWWLGTKEGTGEEVLPPWEPVRVEERAGTVTVRLWGRRYELGEQPFLQRIRSADADLLAAPIRLSARCDGAPQHWREGSLKIGAQRPSSVRIEQRCRSEVLSLTATTTVEYDGLVRLDWQLQPLRPIRLEALTFEIPLAAGAKYLYYWPEREAPWTAHRPGALSGEAVAMKFNPVLWLGDEERGLQWFCESDRNWHYADPEQAIEIVREGQAVLLRLHLVSTPVEMAPEPQSAIPELTYTFGLQATPVKPMKRDAWDYRTACVYTPVYGLEEPGPDGQSALDRLAELGVRTLALMDWTDILCYNAPTHPDRLRQFVAECHRRGLQVLVYFGFQVSDAAPEFPFFGDECALWRTATPGSWVQNPDNYPPKPTQQVVRVCYQSVWSDFVIAGIARLMDEFDLDGVYLDGTGVPVAPCYNYYHGCGYRQSEGKIGGTFAIFAGREVLRRIYAVVKKRKREGQVNLHQSGYLLAPVLAWATNYWDGEQLGGWPPGTFALERLPLDYFRTEFMGRQWGVPAEFLHYCLPANFRQAWAIALLHDVPVRPFVGQWGDVELAAKVWRAMDEFGRQEAEWHPYWRNSQFVSAAPEGAYVSLYRQGERGVLLLVSNLRRDEAEVQVRLNAPALGLYGALSAHDAITGEPLAVVDSGIALLLPSLGWRLVWVQGQTP